MGDSLLTYLAKRLHLACGARYLEGWTNADAVAAPCIQGKVGRPDAVVDIERELHLLPPDHFDQIYWSHGPEHIRPDVLPGVLRDLHRCLGEGGRLTIATTDLLSIIQSRYPDGNWEGPLFGHRYSTDEPHLAHFDCFTPAKLGRLLRAAGFAEVRAWSLSEYPEIAALRDYATTHADCTLYLEGIK